MGLGSRALIGLSQMIVAFGVFLFVPAWSLGFWQAWLYWIVFSLCCFLITLYFLKHAPKLIEARLHAGPVSEKERSQKIIQTLASVSLCLVLIIPGIERHFQKSLVTWWGTLIANGVVILGFVIIFFVFKANSHASSIIEVKSDQRVVSTGPYAWIRHPMYAGAMLIFLATPFALGSWWALPPAVLLCGSVVWRLLDEEKYLVKNLPGYEAYRGKTKKRLIPFVW